MKHRIIKTKNCKTCKEVLVYIDRDDTSDFIKLVAWHTTKEGWLLQTEQIRLTDMVLLESLIEAISEKFVSDFANSMIF